MRARATSLKERRSYTLDEFRGVDFSSSALRVKPYHATNMRNFISENGVNKKRHGWNEIYNAVGKINGIWEYKKGSVTHLLVHSGSTLIRLTKSGEKYTSTTVKTGLLDERSQGFMHDSKLYILSGNLFVYGAFDGMYGIKTIEELAYVPTTTISIENNSISDAMRGSKAKHNLLTAKKKNQLVGAPYTDTPIEWTLDSSIYLGSQVKITVEVADGTYIIRNYPSTETPLKLYKTQKLVQNEQGQWVEQDIVPEVEVGYITQQGVYLDKPDKVVLTMDTTPLVEDDGNIIVEFEDGLGSQALKIKKCKFGATFGVGGSNDRLFLGGNPDTPNIDYHSAINDWTYFPDEEDTIMGSNAIAGYSRLSDSTMVVFKEPSAQESTIYFRTGVMAVVDGVEQEKFPRTAGNVGEGLITRHALGTMNGESWMLSKNGVFAIKLGENIATAERYAVPRSTRINEKLTRHDLSKAVAISSNGKYYLAVDDVCYIADSRYDGEWWYWDNIPVRVWAEIGGELWFGCDDGRICRFDDTYVDKYYTYAGEGTMSIDVVDDKIIADESVNIGVGDEVVFNATWLFGLYLDDCVVSDGKIWADTTNIIEGTEVFVDNVGDSGLSQYEIYTIGEVDRGENWFTLHSYIYGDVPLTSGGFRLARHLWGKQKVTELVEGGFKIGYDLIAYNSNVPTWFSAEITRKKNVVAEWYTPIFDMGTNATSKTLLKMTISTEPEVNGRLCIGYETKNTTRLMNAKGVTFFTFEDFSFENFSFDTGFYSSYSVRVKDRFNFILFRFVSDNGYNCAINNFSIVYKYDKDNKGVR